jgi:hypothetical protein
MLWSELCYSIFWYVGTNILEEYSATTLNMKAEFFSEMLVISLYGLIPKDHESSSCALF